jgi:hypothetical protein
LKDSAVPKKNGPLTSKTSMPAGIPRRPTALGSAGSSSSASSISRVTTLTLVTSAIRFMNRKAARTSPAWTATVSSTSTVRTNGVRSTAMVHAVLL